MSEIPILSILIFIPVVGIFFMLLIRNNDDQSSQNLKDASNNSQTTKSPQVAQESANITLLAGVTPG